MRVKSPLRSRKIRNSVIVGAVAGLSIGYVCYVMTHNLFFPAIFTFFGAVIAGATVALAPSEND